MGFVAIRSIHVQTRRSGTLRESGPAQEVALLRMRHRYLYLFAGIPAVLAAACSVSPPGGASFNPGMSVVSTGALDAGDATINTTTTSTRSNNNEPKT